MEPIVVALALPWLVVGLGCWLGYQLVRQSGRLLLRLEALEERLAALARLPAGSENGHQHHGGNRSLADSRIPRDGLKAGAAAPGFCLPRLDGGELCLEEYRGRRLLLVFSAPDCGPCDALMPDLEASYRAGGPLRGATALAIARNEGGKTEDPSPINVLVVGRGGVEENREKVKQHGLTFPVVLQQKWEISRLYALFATPVGYLIDSDGLIAAPAAQGPGAILELLKPHVATGQAPADGERQPALSAR